MGRSLVAKNNNYNESGGSFARIEELHESESWHFLDYVPFHAVGDDILTYDSFLRNSPYLERFANQIGFIALTLVAEYPAVMILTEEDEFFKTHPDLKPEVNIRDLSFEQLNAIIHDVIVQDLSSVQILFPEQDTLLDIAGELQVALYNASGTFLHNIRLLAQRNGLFLMYHAEDDSIYLDETPDNHPGDKNLP
nr:hypothetical protein [Mobiluncus mulieris]